MNTMIKSLIMGVLALTLSAACTQAKTSDSKKENLKKVETIDIKTAHEIRRKGIFDYLEMFTKIITQ